MPRGIPGSINKVELPSRPGEGIKFGPLSTVTGILFNQGEASVGDGLFVAFGRDKAIWGLKKRSLTVSKDYRK